MKFFSLQSSACLFGLVFCFSSHALSANWNQSKNQTVTSSVNLALDCKTTNYTLSNYPLDWSKSWVPETHSAKIVGSQIISSSGAKGRITRETEKKIEFVFDDMSDSRNDRGFLNGTYFKTNGKLMTQVKFNGRYINSGPIWGECRETIISDVNNMGQTSAKPFSKSVTENESSGGLSLLQAKKECSIIGYNEGTEKFADCVMKFTK